MYDICSAILAINSSAEVSVDNEDYERITWHNGTKVISKSDIQAKQAELSSAYDAKEYQRDRVKPDGYASTGDQLDMQYKDLLNGTTLWKDHVAKVKSDHPKP
jgi:hypothetical protein|tara:strand:- start:743 stop:1051 length:309 start_codon:yes stop_codon:yes gene_type:complete